MNTRKNATNILTPTIDDAPLLACKSGMLVSADECVDYVGTPRSGRPRGPVLVAHCNLARYQAEANDRASIGFGRIAGPGFSVLTIRSQIGSRQIYWLANPSEPRLWSTIDTWRANRQAPTLLVENGMAMYSVHEIDWTPGKSKSRTDDMRVECGRDNSAAFLSFATRLAASGLLEKAATTDLPGVPLSHVEVNVLMTERLKQHAVVVPLCGQPMVTPGPTSMH